MNEATENSPSIPRQDETAAERAETSEAPQDTRIPQDAPPKKRRRGRAAAIAAVCLALLAGLGTAGSFFVRYHLADQAAERGDHAQAYEAFIALGSFQDSPERAAEQYNLLRYAEAEALYQREEFSGAYDIFRELGDFQDAAERAETAQLMIRADRVYEVAMRYYNEEDFDGLTRSYATFERIREHFGLENFRDSAQRMQSLLEKLAGLAVDYAGQGCCYRTPKVLDFLSQKGYPRTEALRAEILSREHIEPDGSYYDMDISRIGSFSGSTTREEFFTLFRCMYLTGTTSLYLPAARGSAASSAYVDRVLARIEDGYRLSEIIFPEYVSVYDYRTTVWWNDAGMDYMDLYTRWNNTYTTDELAAHMEALDAFCRESIRVLNDNLILGASMSREQKAKIVYDWVCFYLSYDHRGDAAIHDAGIAVDKRLGVCESYVAIYARMCNLLGIPTYGQVGITNSDVYGSTHIWAVQEDEGGNLFYTDPTWGDEADYLTGLYELGTDDPYAAFCANYEEGIWSYKTHFWQSELFDSHTPLFEFPYEWVKSVTSK